jgi:hypothetical protein
MWDAVFETKKVFDFIVFNDQLTLKQAVLFEIGYFGDNNYRIIGL